MRRLLMTLCVASAAACGSGTANPAAPSGSPSSDLLVPGRYHLSLTGFDFPGASAEPSCAPAGVPPAGKMVRTELALERLGSEWVGRLASADADLELRVRDGGPVASGRLVSGVLRGWVADRGTPPAMASGVVATIRTTGAGDFALIDGEVPALLPSSVFATALGSIVFADAQGRAAMCPSVQIILGRVDAASAP